MVMVYTVCEEGRVACLPMELSQIDLREIRQELHRIEATAADHPVSVAKQVRVAEMDS